MRTLIWTASVLLLSAPTAWAQSMAEAAEKEKERREKIAETGKESKVVTEKALEAADGELANDPDAEPVAASRPAGAGAARDDWERDQRDADEERWRGRARAAEAKVEEARRDYDEIKSLFLETGAVYVDGATGEVLISSAEQLREVVGKAKEKLEKAEAALEKLHEDARRARVPPGWLR